jgi:hypothetical protein
MLGETQKKPLEKAQFLTYKEVLALPDAERQYVRHSGLWEYSWAGDMYVRVHKPSEKTAEINQGVHDKIVSV